jgi:HAMP domain-containing protein
MVCENRLPHRTVTHLRVLDMLIKTKIRWIYVIFTALLATLAGYQSLVAYSVLSSNRALSQTGFRGAFTALDLLRLKAQIEENTRRWLAQRDENSLAKLKEASEDFAESLNRLKAETSVGKSQQETERLAQFWQQFTSDLESQKLASLGTGSTEASSELDGDLKRLETQMQTVYQIILDSMSSQIEASNKATQDAARNSWLLAAGALLLGVLLLLWHYRSISVPLAQLDEGTQAIAEGKLFVRLDTSRSDEFSRIAKNINDLTRHLQQPAPSSKLPDKAD